MEHVINSNVHTKPMRTSWRPPVVLYLFQNHGAYNWGRKLSTHSQIFFFFLNATNPQK